MTASTSFKLGTDSKADLTALAAKEGLTATDLLKRLIAEGAVQAEYPGIMFHGHGALRRASIAGGPDVWEVVDRAMQLQGDIEPRIAAVADEIKLPANMVRLAVDYYASHEAEITTLIADNRAVEERIREVIRVRSQLIP